MHGGQLAVVALRQEFGLAQRLERQPALDPRTHRGKGSTPLVDVTHRLHCFTSGGVLLADAERLNEDEPSKALLVWVFCLPPATSAAAAGKKPCKRSFSVFRAMPPVRAYPPPCRAGSRPSEAECC